MQISLYNTLSRSTQPFTTADGSSVVRIYSCGPTVYNSAHIGNMRAFLIADLLQRVMRTVGGFDVQWVMNVTDIDDKTIRDSSPHSTEWREEMGERSNDPNEALRSFTEYWTDGFLDDMQTLRVDLDHFDTMPRATDHIGIMMDLVRNIVASGYGYVSDGSVYFNVGTYSSAHAYGRLFTIDKENFQQGVRIDADEYDRESVSDFVLWKARKVGEPYWDLEIDGKVLPGRPGWHLECSAMSREYLGPLPFDVHTGGVDLRFPHHEDEIAQCCAGYGSEDQARFWIHNEFLEVEGKKMSKSLGNFFTLRDLIEKDIDPLDIRYAFLNSHYRSVYNFTFDGVKGARAARLRVQDYIWDLVDMTDGYETAADDVQELRPVFEALADDLHTPRALAALHTYLSDHPAESLDGPAASRLLFELGQVNRVFNVWTAQPRPLIEVPDDVLAVAEARWKARTDANWKEADRLREVLKAMGWSMKDGKEDYELEPLDL
jgi:cysteinyl-tRNA synthetase